jgi:hypothetical protein
MLRFIFVFIVNMPHIYVSAYKKAGAPLGGTGFSAYFFIDDK